MNRKQQALFSSKKIKTIKRLKQMNFTNATVKVNSKTKVSLRDLNNYLTKKSKLEKKYSNSDTVFV